jgi:hypothetical protein
MPFEQSRRRSLTNAAFAGASSFGGVGPWGKALAAEPPPEITSPNKLIARHTDWRFLDELKRELKA